MHFFQSTLQFPLSVALLLPVLLASAYPHALEPQESELIELFEYPSVDSNSKSDATPFVSFTLGEALRPGYSVQWNGESAVAFVAKEEHYEIVVKHLKKDGNFLESGQDEQKRVWIIRTVLEYLVN